MIDLALQAEDLEQLHDLHALYSCLQAIRVCFLAIVIYAR